MQKKKSWFLNDLFQNKKKITGGKPEMTYITEDKTLLTH